ncbi:Hypothetical_protein [Hexamita inflata]|uniref:Hypothetical_protein n=1 Tax=Hexamita inflata TaxID=28002 RepID=A0AA86TWG4_9EUKA|nr:Hypothetical protein HINF_LOCUS19395 [Hexamita inflata]
MKQPTSLTHNIKSTFLTQLIGNLSENSMISDYILRKYNTNKQKLTNQLSNDSLKFEKISSNFFQNIDQIEKDVQKTQIVFSYKPPQKPSKLLPYFQQFKSTKVKPFNYYNFETQTKNILTDTLNQIFQFNLNINASDQVKLQIIKNYQNMKLMNYKQHFQLHQIINNKVVQLSEERVQLEGECICVYYIFDQYNNIIKGNTKPTKHKYQIEIGNNKRIESLKISILNCTGELGYEF